MKKLMLSMLLVVSASPAFAMASPIGNWRTADGKATVHIRRCGRADLCASTGGKTVFHPMRPAGRNLWAGTILDARSGDKYDGQISLVSPDALKVHGCFPGGGMCGDQTWMRVR
ncbi:MAG TPA: DUF2147 domain-containing protein [Beijerinckiaceae bacterium]|nr:DUF2147 domain-containing protein [Beijerinckiaceae bacterium]